MLSVKAVVDFPKVRRVEVDEISRDSLGRFVRGALGRSVDGG